MNILIVDDDAYVLQGLKQGLDWGSLDINNVFTAPNVSKSKQIIESQSVQILICDIEMPKENGFVLLDWMKQNRIDMNVIMLTSHAEFKYAAQAIKYNCDAYALKPIDFDELNGLVSNAVSNAKKRLSLSDHKIYQEFWQKSENKRKEELIIEYLHNPDSVTLDEESQAWLETPILPVIFKFIASSPDDYDLEKQEASINSIISGLYQTDDINIIANTSLPANGKLVILTLSQSESDPLNSEFDKSMIETINEFKNRLHTQLATAACIHDSQGIIEYAIIIGNWEKIIDFQRRFKLFVLYADSTIPEAGAVDIPESYELFDVKYISPDFDLWERFLLDKQYETVDKEAIEYIDHLYKIRKLSKNNLSKFFVDLRQLVSAVMKTNKIYASAKNEVLFKDDFLRWATQSVECAKKAASMLIRNIRESNESPDMSAVEVVKRYISENLDEDLTREKLADIVFLNSDYLARIFKKETNESLSNFISRKRIEIAQEYLTRTNQSVNIIAGLVGFDNVSYFSKVFKERVGMTPKEYRKNN